MSGNKPTMFRLDAAEFVPGKKTLTPAVTKKDLKIAEPPPFESQFKTSQASASIGCGLSVAPSLLVKDPVQPFIVESAAKQGETAHPIPNEEIHVEGKAKFNVNRKPDTLGGDEGSIFLSPTYFGLQGIREVDEDLSLASMPGNSSIRAKADDVNQDPLNATETLKIMKQGRLVLRGTEWVDQSPKLQSGSGPGKFGAIGDRSVKSRQSTDDASETGLLNLTKDFRNIEIPKSEVASFNPPKGPRGYKYPNIVPSNSGASRQLDVSTGSSDALTGSRQSHASASGGTFNLPSTSLENNIPPDDFPMSPSAPADISSFQQPSNIGIFRVPKNPPPTPRLAFATLVKKEPCDNFTEFSAKEAFESLPNEMAPNKDITKFPYMLANNLFDRSEARGAGATSHNQNRQRAATLTVNTELAQNLPVGGSTYTLTNLASGMSQMQQFSAGNNSIMPIFSAAEVTQSARLASGPSGNSFKLTSSTSVPNDLGNYQLGGSKRAPDPVGTGRCSAASSSENSKEASTSKKDAEDDPVAKAAERKWLADFIKAGGLEPQRVHSTPSTAVTPVYRGQPGNGVPQQQGPLTLYLPSWQSPPQDTDTMKYLIQFEIAGLIPLWDELVRGIPFCALHALARPHIWGVVRIADMPYDATRQEIIAMFGRNARIINLPRNSGHFSVNIIYDRPTAKSYDCFVEMLNNEEAKRTVNRINDPRHGKKPTLQSRNVRVMMSNTEDFMKAIFPRAKCVFWQGQVPKIAKFADSMGNHFRGFVDQEEMFLTKQGAEKPKRRPHSGKHYQRVYESMITLMHKYPWFAADYYTIGERNYIFEAVLHLLNHLSDHLIRNPEYPPPNKDQIWLTKELLDELILVALSVPAFSEYQRFQVSQISKKMGTTPPAYVTPKSNVWPFQVLRMKLDVGEDLVDYYAGLLNAATATKYPEVSANPNNPFGKFHVRYPPWNHLRHQTLAEVANYEMATIQVELKTVAPTRNKP